MAARIIVTIGTPTGGTCLNFAKRLKSELRVSVSVSRGIFPHVAGLQHEYPIAMSYSEFTLEAIEARLGIVTREASLFLDAPAAEVPDWLPGLLARGTRLALISEKARSEFIVVPILLAARELSGDQFAIYSGQRLDVDHDKGLMGECDFILAVGPALPPMHAPIMTVVEAKKNDIEVGLGQCIAQMAGARKFNEAAGRATAPVYGCVTTGETWQFLRLTDQVATLDRERYYLDNVSGILRVLQAIFQDALKAGLNKAL